MNEITKITRLLFDRPTLMNFKTQDQKVSPRYGRMKKKDEKSRRLHGIFCTGRESKNYAGKWFHILAVGNTVIIFADVTSCSPCILVKLWLISLSQKYTGAKLHLLSSWRTLFSLQLEIKHGISFLELKFSFNNLILFLSRIFFCPLASKKKTKEDTPFRIRVFAHFTSILLDLKILE